MRSDDKQTDEKSVVIPTAEKSVVIDGHEHTVRVFAMQSRPKSMWRPYSGKQRKAEAKDPMEGKIIGFIADDEQIEALRTSGLSWREVAEELEKDSRVAKVKLTRAEADWLAGKNGARLSFARWIHGRLVIRTRLVRRLSDLSARLGFDGRGNTARTSGKNQSEFGHMADKCDWIGAYIREQFGKLERGEGGYENGNNKDFNRENFGAVGVA